MAESRPRLTLPLAVHKVDEMGFFLVTKHLIPKGTVFWMSAPSVTEITGVTTPLQVSVASNEVLPIRVDSITYVEFENRPMIFSQRTPLDHGKEKRKEIRPPPRTLNVLDRVGLVTRLS